MRRLAVLAVVAGVAVGLAAGPAWAQPTPDLRIARKRSGPYFGKDEFLADETTITASIAPGEAKTFYLKERDDHSNAAKILSGSPSPLGWKLKWFKGFKGHHEITGPVQYGGYGYSSPQGAVRRFRLRVKAGSGAACIHTTVSLQGPTEIDRVQVAANDPGACNP